MLEGDDLTQVQAYQQLVLKYEAAHAEVNALLQTHQGGTEFMTEQEIAHYRLLARQRDELLNEIRWMEQQLLDEDSTL